MLTVLLSLLVRRRRELPGMERVPGLHGRLRQQHDLHRVQPILLRRVVQGERIEDLDRVEGQAGRAEGQVWVCLRPVLGLDQCWDCWGEG